MENRTMDQPLQKSMDRTAKAPEDRSILDTIARQRRVRLTEKQQELPLSALQALVEQMPEQHRPSMKAALANDGLGFVCEVKRASPSKGIICAQADPVDLARQYEAAGAAAISCLCEPDWFLGSDADLRAIAQAVDLPVLKKDFIIDPYMIYEAKRDGASCILLIAALLDLQQLQDYTELAHQLGLEVLLEVHNAREMEQALQVPVDVIGINNRDLHTFTIDLNTFVSLAEKVPADVVCLCESGIHTRHDVERVCQVRCDGLLMGEACMQAPDKTAFLQALRPEGVQ